MKIYVTSVFVDDQKKALAFYTNKLGFIKKTDIPMGEYRWLTVESSEQQNGVELLLEPSAHPATPPFKQALYSDGIPFTSFQVANLAHECARLKSLDVAFHQKPMEADGVKIAVIDDTCGNLIQLIEILE